ncbi:MAG: hypothetical protein FJY77_03195 [Candidatus Altiarchaeales archaeon]|nr:hypothetical protein [Candidatus Altiarchaeales archaeon]
MAKVQFPGFDWNFRVIAVLILISVLNWFLFGAFEVKVYYTLIPLLFAIQLFLNGLLEYFLVLKVNSALWFSLLVLPGTMLHELSHAAAVLLTGGKITSLSLFSLNKKTGTLGSVTYVSKSDRFSFLRNLLIAFAPFFGCGVALVFISNLFFHQTVSLGIQEGFTGLPQKFFSSLDLLAGQYLQAGIDRPIALLALYLQLCFAFGTAPSIVDFQTIPSSIRKNLLGFLLAVVILIMPAILIQYQLPLDSYGSAISHALVVLLDRIILLLILSIVLLSTCLLLVYSVSSWLSASITSKIVSIVVSVLSYFISMSVGVPKVSSLLISWVVFVAFLFLLKNKSLFIREKVSSS